jgi:hypothetical protein
MPAMHGAYTDFPEMPPNVVFPRPEMQALSAVICQSLVLRPDVDRTR